MVKQDGDHVGKLILNRPFGEGRAGRTLEMVTTCGWCPDVPVLRNDQQCMTRDLHAHYKESPNNSGMIM